MGYVSLILPLSRTSQKAAQTIPISIIWRKLQMIKNSLLRQGQLQNIICRWHLISSFKTLRKYRKILRNGQKMNFLRYANQCKILILKEHSDEIKNPKSYIRICKDPMSLKCRYSYCSIVDLPWYSKSPQVIQSCPEY